MCQASAERILLAMTMRQTRDMTGDWARDVGNHLL